MEKATPPGSDGPRVPQTMAALLEEIASLRKENEEQRRELQQLRGAAQLSPHQSDKPPHPSAMPRFKDFPYEIREMIWELALPRRLLGCEGLRLKDVVPTDLNVPAIAHVCQEARNFAKSKNHISALPGEFDLPLEEDQTSPSWLKDIEPACETWFSPRTDILLINPEGFLDVPYEESGKCFLALAAEHIVVEHWLWNGYHEEVLGTMHNIFFTQTTDDLLKNLTDWVHHVYATPFLDKASWARTRGPTCRLRTVDFPMTEVTMIDRNSPPQLLHRLFGEEDYRMVDLSGTESVEILRMLGYFLSQGLEPGLFLKWTRKLESALAIYQSAAEEIFPELEPSLLTALVSACYEASNNTSSEGHETLPTPFKSGGTQLDMDVTWVKEFSERLTVRPVHVFLLGEEEEED